MVLTIFSGTCSGSCLVGFLNIDAFAPFPDVNVLPSPTSSTLISWYNGFSKENLSMSMIHKDPRKEEEPSPEPIDPPTDAPPLEAPQDPANAPNI